MKYFKPKSLTWWAGIGLIIYGVADSLSTQTMSPHLLEGLTAIGFRGAIK